jgi:multidrug efflux pump
MASGQFAFPPIIDVKIDEAKTEIVLDRDKIASMGLTLQQVGSDLSDARRQLRQPLQHRRAKLQGHRADRARFGASPRPARDIHIGGPLGT